uniref:Sigma A core clamp protein n=1 Tax=Cataraqui virus TaxID=2776967 RepID=A0A8E4VR27_9REOV|nr:MAG: sigma A core clamp protein [Cataraqui virus]QPB10695.1 MAG: sigma A core clamp protein [Cataraqui virus]
MASLLTSSNSPWQSQNNPLFTSVSPGLVVTPDQPFPGSRWFQEAMLFSAFVPPILPNADAWRDVSFADLCWTDSNLSGLVRARDPLPAPPYVPVSGQWFDLTRYPRWANRMRDLQSKYPILLRSTLLNMMRSGPLLYVETWPNMISGRLADWFMQSYGQDFKEMVMRFYQSALNIPFERDGTYDRQMRSLLSLWLLSYAGVVHQNATIAGFYFSTKSRGTNLESWTLFYSTNGARLNITQNHFGYFCARSPDWNADQNWLAAAALTSLIMSCRQCPIMSNQDVIVQAQNRPNFTGPNGSPVREIQLLGCATECIRRWQAAGLLTQQKAQSMQQAANDFNQQVQQMLDDIKAADDAQYNQQPGYARRIKPYRLNDWTIGQTMQSLAALAAFAT